VICSPLVAKSVVVEKDKSAERFCLLDDAYSISIKLDTGGVEFCDGMLMNFIYDLLGNQHDRKQLYFWVLFKKVDNRVREIKIEKLTKP
jgi:hypothetical protein